MKIQQYIEQARDELIEAEQAIDNPKKHDVALLHITKALNSVILAVESLENIHHT